MKGALIHHKAKVSETHRIHNSAALHVNRDTHATSLGERRKGAPPSGLGCISSPSDAYEHMVSVIRWDATYTEGWTAPKARSTPSKETHSLLYAEDVP